VSSVSAGSDSGKPDSAISPATVVTARINSRPSQCWTLAQPHPQAPALADAARLPLILAELLTARGITTPEAAFQFLNPSMEQLNDPMTMRGMPAAVGRLEQAIAHGETILLYGDYDVDGTTAVVLLKTAIEMLGSISTNNSSVPRPTVRFHVPHRLREGYGLQSSVLEAAAAEGVSLVITVDTGMRAFAEAETARALGLDLIITDHHLPEASDAIPHALAILNPNQPECAYPEKSLCGAAIAFKLAQALLERSDPDRARAKILPSFLKMVAIATVADAVPLLGENRVLAALGIRELHRPAGVGLKALLAAASLDPQTRQLTSFDLGFRLGPRINAAGRMDIASEVVELFTTRDQARATTLAQKLEQLNTERRATEAAALEAIDTRLASDSSLQDKKVLILAGHGWHRGVIGILASRVVERTAKPALVLSIEDGIAHGSGRSIDGFPLLQAIEPCADLFTRFGGHAFAVGFAMPAENLDEMERRVQAFADIKLARRVAQHTLRIHGELPLERITPVLAGWMKKLEPLGHGNPEPILLAKRVRLTAAVRVMKEKHIRLEVTPAETRVRMAPMKAVGWKLAAQAEAMGLEAGSVIDLAYRVREDERRQAIDANGAGMDGIELEIAGMRWSEVR